jgi:hypothetical protein
MKDFLVGFDDNPIPYLGALRRAPMRYRHILPLTIIKRYQCLVVGAAKGKLTVAIASRRNMEVIEFLGRYTGKTIFPVLVDPSRMQLLIQRIERCEQCSRNSFMKLNQAGEMECYLYTLRRNEINAILILITSQRASGLR